MTNRTESGPKTRSRSTIEGVLNATALPPEHRDGTAAFCHALVDALGGALRSIVLYGSLARDEYRPGKSDINLLVVTDHIDTALLNGLLEPLTAAKRYAISPFVLTEENLRSSTDVFPIKFGSIVEAYTLLWGADILAELDIGREHLRLRCEQETKNLLLRLRRWYLLQQGRRLTQILAQQGHLIETLRTAVALAGDGSAPARKEAVAAAATMFALDRTVLDAVLSIKRRTRPLPEAEATRLYGQYMGQIEKLAQIVDRME